MKKVILIAFILISIGASAQQKDSMQIASEAWNKQLDSVMTKTSIKQFQTWLYERLSAKEYAEQFSGVFEYFIRQKYLEFTQTYKPKR